MSEGWLSAKFNMATWTIWGLIFPDMHCVPSIPYFPFPSAFVSAIAWYQRRTQTSYDTLCIVLIAQYCCNKFYLNTKITVYIGRPHFWPRSFSLWPKMAARRNERHNYFSQDATALHFSISVSSLIMSYVLFSISYRHTRSLIIYWHILGIVK